MPVSKEPLFSLLVDCEQLESGYQVNLTEIFQKIEDTPAIRQAYLGALRPRVEEYQNSPTGYQVDERELFGIGSMTSYELGFTFRETWLPSSQFVLFEVLLDSQDENEIRTRALSFPE